MATEIVTGAQALAGGEPTLTEPTGNSEFLNGFEEADRAYLTEHQINSTADLLAHAKGADKFAGVDLEKMVALPTKETTPEQMAAFYTKLGRPETAEGYTLPTPEGDNGEFAKAMAPILFDAGLSAAQATKLAEGYNALNQAHAQALEEAYQKEQASQMTALKTEWGKDYDKNTELGRQAARTFGLGAQELEALERSIGSGNLMKMMFNIGAKIMDAPIKGASNPGQPSAYTPKEARTKLEALKKDPDFVAKFLRGDAATVKLFNELTDAGAM